MLFRRRKSEVVPISATLLEAARLLELPQPVQNADGSLRVNDGFLLQAQIIRDLARRAKRTDDLDRLSSDIQSLTESINNLAIDLIRCLNEWKLRR